MPAIVLTQEPEYPDARLLIDRMYDEEALIYGGTDEGKFSPLDLDQPGALLIVARINNVPVGCGAIRPLVPGVGIGAGVGEIKRMYVEPAWRRQGIARAILAELERHARTFGYQSLYLETGIKQPSAIQLYESAGFQRIAPYGRYVGDPISVCFGKGISSSLAVGDPAPKRMLLS